MSDLLDSFGWLTTASNWTGEAGILNRLWQHVQYSALAIAIAVAVALPLGLAIGHLRRGGFVVIGASGAVRALPTLGLLVLLGTGRAFQAWPIIVVLVILAVPPILANTYAGVAGVDAAARDAAKGVGMTGVQVLRTVEAPLALPLILTGVRSATSQVIATATIAAFMGLGGLGRFIIDGFSVRDFPRVYGGAIVVAGLALASEALFAVAQRFTSPGLPRARRLAAREAVVPSVPSALDVGTGHA